MVYIGIICFALCFVFALVTLPVEYNASMRAKDLMVTAGVVSYEEANDSSKVLYAAFLTYVAAAVSSLLTLLYYLWRSGLLGNNGSCPMLTKSVGSGLGAFRYGVVCVWSEVCVCVFGGVCVCLGGGVRALCV